MRYVKAKTSGYYFEPTKAMRAAGLRPESLGRDATAAAARAALLLDDWDRFRKGDAAPSEKPAHGTINWLIEQFRCGPEYAAYKAKTQNEFDRLSGQVAAKFGRFQAAAIERRFIKAFFRDLLAVGSADNAARAVKNLHLLLELARDEGLVSVNNASRMKLPTGTARTAVWSASEVDTLIAKAQDEGRPSMALAIRIAFDTGQRLGDVLTMMWSQYTGSHILVTQGKTGARIAVKVMADLKARLDAITPRSSTHIVVSEETGRPYRVDNFSHLFRRIANSAGFQNKQFLDLRRSAAVRLAEAGATTEEIVAITGHSIERGAQILEVYIPRSTAMADNAIDKLENKNKAAQKVGKPIRKSGKSGAP